MVRLLQAGYGDFFTMVFGDKIMALDTRDCLIRAPREKLVVLKDLENYIVVDEGDALLKHIEGCGWNERYAEQARNMMERARAQDPGNARLPALTTFYYNLLKRYGIEP